MSACSESVKETSEDQPLKEGNIALGKELYIVCAGCHGANGEGIKALNAPALVNQETWYLEKQLNNFRLGIRGNDPENIPGTQMATIAKTLTGADQVSDVAAYIKTLPPTTTEQTISGDIEKGRNYYHMICGACHGKNAVGNPSLNSPRLAGIDDWYLEAQFNLFKNGIRGMHPDDTHGAQMQAMSNSLPDDQALKDVIAYIQSLQNLEQR